MVHPLYQLGAISVAVSSTERDCFFVGSPEEPKGQCLALSPRPREPRRRLSPGCARPLGHAPGQKLQSSFSSLVSWSTRQGVKEHIANAQARVEYAC